MKNEEKRKRRNEGRKWQVARQESAMIGSDARKRVITRGSISFENNRKNQQDAGGEKEGEQVEAEALITQPNNELDH